MDLIDQPMEEGGKVEHSAQVVVVSVSVAGGAPVYWWSGSGRSCSFSRGRWHRRGHLTHWRWRLTVQG